MKITEIECNECREVKPTSAFHVKSSSATGFYPYCKDCRRAKSGHKPRKLPEVREPESKVDTQGLIQDVFHLEKTYPKNFTYRKAASFLRSNPEGPHPDEVADVLFHCWNKRQRHAGITDELDKESPVLSEDKQNKIDRREFTNIFGRYE